jgi:hypothetical protein
VIAEFRRCLSMWLVGLALRVRPSADHSDFRFARHVDEMARTEQAEAFIKFLKGEACVSPSNSRHS